MGNQLLRIFDCNRQNRSKEVNQTLSMGCIFVVEIDAIVFSGDLKDFVIDAMLEDQLLDVVECLFMVDVLSDLHYGTPSVWSELFFAVIALSIGLDKLSYKGLLYFGLVVQLLLDGYFDFDSFGVLLSPNEPSVDDLGPVQTLHLLEQEGEQLFAIPFAGDPWRSHVAMAEAAEINDSFLSNPYGYIGLGEHAGLTNIREFRLKLNAAHGTEDGGLVLCHHYVLFFQLHC